MERPGLASELTEMARDDLAARQRLAASGALFDGYHPEMRALHRRNGDRLAEILDEIGSWPGRQLVGVDGSSAAFLIAIHDIAKPLLMRRSRKLYAKAVERGDANPAELARLDDRIRYFEGRPQRYGTHWGWDDDGEFGLWPPVEEPALVDDRRRKVGLAPLAGQMSAARRRAANEGRPSKRSVETVREEHQAAEDFAVEVGWRTRSDR